MKRRPIPLAPPSASPSSRSGAAIVFAVPRLPDRGNAVPTALVTKGPLKVTVHANGELRAGRTMTLVTPPVGGMLRIVQMKTDRHAGQERTRSSWSSIPADQEYALEQAKSELAEAEQEIVKMKADADVQKAQDDVALLTARFDVRRGRARCERQRAHPGRRGTEERADARGGEARGWRSSKRTSSRERRQTRHRSPSFRRSATRRCSGMQRAQQLIDSLVLKAPMDGTVVGQGEPRRHQLLRSRDGDSRVPRGRLGVAGPAGGRRHRVRQDGGAREDRRERPRQPHCRSAGVASSSTRCPGETFTVKVGALSGLASRAQWYESATRHAALRRHLPVRQARPSAEGRRVRARDDRGQGDSGRAARAAAGRVREERQDARLREDRRPVRAARGQGRAPAPRAARRSPACRKAREVALDGSDGAPRPTSNSSSPTLPAAGASALGHGRYPHRRHDVRLPARAAARVREPARAQAALAADDAGDDLRRGGGRGHAVDRRRRAAGSDGVHRAARRAQPDRRGARVDRLPGRCRRCGSSRPA